MCKIKTYSENNITFLLLLQGDQKLNYMRCKELATNVSDRKKTLHNSLSGKKWVSTSAAVILLSHFYLFSHDEELCYIFS